MAVTDALPADDGEPYDLACDDDSEAEARDDAELRAAEIRLLDADWFDDKTLHTQFRAELDQLLIAQRKRAQDRSRALALKLKSVCNAARQAAAKVPICSKCSSAESGSRASDITQSSGQWALGHVSQRGDSGDALPFEMPSDFSPFSLLTADSNPEVAGTDAQVPEIEVGVQRLEPSQDQSLEAQLNSLREELAASEARRQTLERTTRDLERQLAASQHQVALLSETKTQHVHAIAQLEGKLAATKEELSTTQDKLGRSQEEVAQLTESNAQHNSMIAQLQRELQATNQHLPTAHAGLPQTPGHVEEGQSPGSGARGGEDSGTSAYNESVVPVLRREARKDHRSALPPAVSQTLPTEMPPLGILSPPSAMLPDPAEHGASSKDAAGEYPMGTHALPFEMPPLDLSTLLSMASQGPPQHGACSDSAAVEEPVLGQEARKALQSAPPPLLPPLSACTDQDELERTARDLQAELQYYIECIGRLEEQLAMTRSALDASQEERKKAFHTALTTVAERLMSMTTVAERLEEEAMQMTADMQAMHLRNLNKLQESLECTTKELARSKQELERTNSDLQRQILASQEEVAQLSDTRAQHENTIAQLEGEIDATRRQLAQAQERMERITLDLQGQLAARKEEIDQATKATEQHQITIAQLEGDLDAMKHVMNQHLSQTQSALEAAAQSEHQLRQRLTEKEAALQDSRAEASSLGVQLEQVSEQLARVSADRDDTALKLSNIQDTQRQAETEQAAGAAERERERERERETSEITRKENQELKAAVESEKERCIAQARRIVLRILHSQLAGAFDLYHDRLLETKQKRERCRRMILRMQHTALASAFDTFMGTVEQLRAHRALVEKATARWNLGLRTAMSTWRHCTDEAMRLRRVASMVLYRMERKLLFTMFAGLEHQVHMARSVSGAPVSTSGLAVTLKLDLDFSVAGSEGSRERRSFQRQVVDDLARAVECCSDCFRVQSMSAGSVIIRMIIETNGVDDEGVHQSPSQVLTSLQTQIAEQDSRLRSGFFTSQVLSLTADEEEAASAANAHKEAELAQNERIAELYARVVGMTAEVEESRMLMLAHKEAEFAQNKRIAELDARVVGMTTEVEESRMLMRDITARVDARLSHLMSLLEHSDAQLSEHMHQLKQAAAKTRLMQQQLDALGAQASQNQSLQESDDNANAPTTPTSGSKSYKLSRLTKESLQAALAGCGVEVQVREMNLKMDSMREELLSVPSDASPKSPVMKMTLGLPITAAEFSDDVRLSFRGAIAASMNTDVSKVQIMGVSTTSSSRRLASSQASMTPNVSTTASASVSPFVTPRSSSASTNTSPSFHARIAQEAAKKWCVERGASEAQESQVERLQAREEASQAQIQDLLSHVIQTAQGKMEETTQKLKETSQKLKETRQMLQCEQQRSKQLQAKVDAMTTQHEQLKARMESQMDQATPPLASGLSRTDLAEEILADILTEVETGLAAQLEALCNTVMQTQNTLRGKAEEIAGLQDRISKLETGLDSKDGELLREKERLERDKKAAVQTARDLARGGLEALKEMGLEALKEMKEKTKGLEQTHKELQDTNIQLQEEKKQAQAELGSVREMLKQVQEDLDACKLSLEHCYARAASQGPSDPDLVPMTVKLGMDFKAAGDEGSLQRSKFEKDLVSDLATASGVAADRFKIRKLAPGSVLVGVDIYPEPSGRGPSATEVSEELENQAHDPSSALRRGKVTSSVSDIALPHQQLLEHEELKRLRATSRKQLAKELEDKGAQQEAEERKQLDELERTTGDLERQLAASQHQVALLSETKAHHEHVILQLEVELATSLASLQQEVGKNSDASADSETVVPVRQREARKALRSAPPLPVSLKAQQEMEGAGKRDAEACAENFQALKLSQLSQLSSALEDAKQRHVQDDPVKGLSQVPDTEARASDLESALVVLKAEHQQRAAALEARLAELGGALALLQENHKASAGLKVPTKGALPEERDKIGKTKAISEKAEHHLKEKAGQYSEKANPLAGQKLVNRSPFPDRPESQEGTRNPANASELSEAASNSLASSDGGKHCPVERLQPQHEDRKGGEDSDTSADNAPSHALPSEMPPLDILSLLPVASPDPAAHARAHAMAGDNECTLQRAASKAKIIAQLQPLLDALTWDEAAPLLAKMDNDFLQTALSTGNVQPVMAKLKAAGYPRPEMRKLQHADAESQLQNLLFAQDACGSSRAAEATTASAAPAPPTGEVSETMKSAAATVGNVRGACRDGQIVHEEEGQSLLPGGEDSDESADNESVAPMRRKTRRTLRSAAPLMPPPPACTDREDIPAIKSEEQGVCTAFPPALANSAPVGQGLVEGDAGVRATAGGREDFSASHKTPSAPHRGGNRKAYTWGQAGWAPILAFDTDDDQDFEILPAHSPSESVNHHGASDAMYAWSPSPRAQHAQTFPASGVLEPVSLGSTPPSSPAGNIKKPSPSKLQLGLDFTHWFGAFGAVVQMPANIPNSLSSPSRAAASAPQPRATSQTNDKDARKVPFRESQLLPATSAPAASTMIPGQLFLDGEELLVQDPALDMLNCLCERTVPYRVVMRNGEAVCQPAESATGSCHWVCVDCGQVHGAATVPTPIDLSSVSPTP